MELPGRILILVYLGLYLGVRPNVAQDLATAAQRAEQLLNQTELNIRKLVTQVESNARNSCGMNP